MPCFVPPEYRHLRWHIIRLAEVPICDPRPYGWERAEWGDWGGKVENDEGRWVRWGEIPQLPSFCRAVYYGPAADQTSPYREGIDRSTDDPTPALLLGEDIDWYCGGPIVVGVDTAYGADERWVLPMPYKGPDAAFLELIDIVKRDAAAQNHSHWKTPDACPERHDVEVQINENESWNARCVCGWTSSMRAYSSMREFGAWSDYCRNHGHGVLTIKDRGEFAARQEDWVPGDLIGGILEDAESRITKALSLLELSGRPVAWNKSEIERQAEAAGVPIPGWWTLSDEHVMYYGMPRNWLAIPTCPNCGMVGKNHYDGQLRPGTSCPHDWHTHWGTAARQMYGENGAVPPPYETPHGLSDALKKWRSALHRIEDQTPTRASLAAIHDMDPNTNMCRRCKKSSVHIHANPHSECLIDIDFMAVTRGMVGR